MKSETILTYNQQKQDILYINLNITEPKLCIPQLGPFLVIDFVVKYEPDDCDPFEAAIGLDRVQAPKMY